MFEKIRDVLAKQFELDPATITRATNLIDELDIRRGEPKPLRVEEEKI